jgi:hypothetical protein
MTERELDLIIDNAPERKVRECLKEIASLWFVARDMAGRKYSPEGSGIATFDKPIDGDIIEAVTGALHTHGFSPKEGT